MENYDREQHRSGDGNSLARRLFEIGQEADRLRQDQTKSDSDGLRKLGELEQQANAIYGEAEELATNRLASENHR
jgi:hypothetical protein